MLFLSDLQLPLQVFLHSFGNKILTERQDRRVALVKNVGRRLLKANTDLPNIREHEWEVCSALEISLIGSFSDLRHR